MPEGGWQGRIARDEDRVSQSLMCVFCLCNASILISSILPGKGGEGLLESSICNRVPPELDN